MIQAPPFNLNSTIEKLQKLPENSQKHIAEIIDFFYFKAFSTLYEEFLEEQYELSNKDKIELKRRIQYAEEYPDSVIDGDIMKEKWENKLGIKL